MAARTSSDPSDQASLGDAAEETPRYARKPIEFRHRARLVLGQGDLNLIECDPLKLLLDGHALAGAPPGAARIGRQTVLADPIQAGKVLQ